MQGRTTRARHAADDRAARKLVPECHSVDSYLDQAPSLRLSEDLDARHESVHELRVHTSRYDRQLLHSRPRGRRQVAHPRHHGVYNGCGDAAPPAGEHLRNEERVAARDREKLVNVDINVLGELDECLTTEWSDPQSENALSGQGAHQAWQATCVVDVIVTTREDDDGVHGLDPPDEVTQRVDGRIVRPVQVLDDEHAWPRPSQLCTQRLVHRLTIRV